MAVHERVIVAGGTTFWLSALVRPLADLPRSVPEVRGRLEEMEDPHTALRALDPEAAERLHPNDRVRVVRALEVHAITGLTQSELHQRGPKTPPLGATVAWMDHADIYDRINRRTAQMVEEGYVAEVEGLLNGGHNRDLKPLKAFAYRHIIEHCLDGLELDEALRRTARDTRHYAKKQRNWAKKLCWLPTDAESVRATAKGLFSGT